MDRQLGSRLTCRPEPELGGIYISIESDGHDCTQRHAQYHRHIAIEPVVEQESSAMKGRESGMPDEQTWQMFYDADCIVAKLECVRNAKEIIIEFGSGYGTFTLPVARRTSGTVYALDIEPHLIAQLREKAGVEGLSNIRADVRDFVEHGTGLPSETADHAMVYNILHIEDPIALLKEACRVLKPGGMVSIIHWKYDPTTPRGPSMDIRPLPESCRAWAEAAGFVFVRYQDLSDCCAYHYGMVAMRPVVPSEAA
jgi:SAM-dependent methyltransferase